jgi:hypothetical protein
MKPKVGRQTVLFFLLERKCSQAALYGMGRVQIEARMFIERLTYISLFQKRPWQLIHNWEGLCETYGPMKTAIAVV